MRRAKVTLSPEALADLAEIRAYYLEVAGPVVSQRVIGRIRRALARIRDFPDGGSLREEYGASVRLRPAAPYVIYTQAQSKDVEVLRILHVARDRDAIMRDRKK